MKNTNQSIKQQSRAHNSKLIKLPNSKISPSQLAIGLNLLARQHHISLPILIRKLDQVSGNLKDLQKLLEGDTKCQWTSDQDKLLKINQSIMIRWRGKNQVQKRKKYLDWQKLENQVKIELNQLEIKREGIQESSKQYTQNKEINKQQIEPQ